MPKNRRIKWGNPEPITPTSGLLRVLQKEYVIRSKCGRFEILKKNVPHTTGNITRFILEYKLKIVESDRLLDFKTIAAAKDAAELENSELPQDGLDFHTSFSDCFKPKGD